MAGGTAGFSQFVATNPMEIVKIRMQLMNKKGIDKPVGQVVRELGLRGLYKGTSATLLRDIPFSVVFFATYGKLKDDWAGEDLSKVLVSGTREEERIVFFVVAQFFSVLFLSLF